MLLEQFDGQLPRLAFDNSHPALAGRSDEAAAPVASDEPLAGAAPAGPADTLEALLLLVACGDQAAFVTLRDRTVGLVRVNVRRVLRDASRSEAVTEQAFADVREDAVHFDPQRDSAQAWLLTHAYQCTINELRVGADADHRDPPASKLDQSIAVALP